MLSHIDHVGDVLYIFSVTFGLISWGFAIIWFVIAVMMLGTAGRFPFNMGWWGFIFPIGTECTFPSANSHYIDQTNDKLRSLYATYNNTRRRVRIPILQSSFLCKFMKTLPTATSSFLRTTL